MNDDHVPNPSHGHGLVPAHVRTIASPVATVAKTAVSVLEAEALLTGSVPSRVAVETAIAAPTDARIIGQITDTHRTVMNMTTSAASLRPMAHR